MSWKELSDEIMPFFALKKANAKLNEKNLPLLNNTDSAQLEYMSAYKNLSLNQIKEYFAASLETKKVIEEKLRTSLLSLTLASSFTVGYTGLILSDGLRKQGLGVLWLVELFLGAAVFYFIASGIIVSGF